MNSTLASLMAGLLLCGSGPAQQTDDELTPLVIVVHADNPKIDLSSDELLSYFKMVHQWWPKSGWPKPDRKRATLVLRGSRSEETKALLESVYKMSASELRKYWVGKVFRGEIPRKPAVVTKTKDVLARIAKDQGAFSIVRATDVTKAVRVLTINGKQPGEKGYLLNR